MSNINHKEFTGTHCRMARAGLQMSMRDLELASGLSRTTISKFENEHIDIKDSTKGNLVMVFNKRGAEFQMCDEPMNAIVSVRKQE